MKKKLSIKFDPELTKISLSYLDLAEKEEIKTFHKYMESEYKILMRSLKKREEVRKMSERIVTCFFCGESTYYDEDKPYCNKCGNSLRLSAEHQKIIFDFYEKLSKLIYEIECYMPRIKEEDK